MKAQAIAGTVVVVTASILGGIVFLVHTVPTQLNQVLVNQQAFRGRLETVERDIKDHGSRIIRLEARP